MKFGRNLPRNEVPEWSSEYINYKGLKKLIKSASDGVKDGEEADLANFFYNLDRQLESIDAFYNHHHSLLSRRLRLLHDRYGASPDPSTLDHQDLDDLLAALLELRGQLRKLQWYGEVNRRGFIKITKKLDKKVSSACAQQKYLITRVDPRAFATNAEVSSELALVNEALSKLGDGKTLNGLESARSSFSMSTRPLGLMKLKLPPELVQLLDQALTNDDAKDMTKILQQVLESFQDNSDAFQRLLLNYLQRAISARAKKCICLLLAKVNSLDEPDDINKRNCFHRLIIGVGKNRSSKANIPIDGASPELEAMNTIAPAEAPMLELPSYALKEIDSSRLPDGGDDTAELVKFLLDELKPEQRTSIKAQDVFGRMPIHYAAKYGFIDVCKLLMQKLQEWNLLDMTDGVDSEQWQDAEGNSPLSLAVIGGWRLTVETLLEASRSISSAPSPAKAWSKANLLLALATKANFPNIVRLLLRAGADVNFQDEQGETALHTAARFGHDDCARALIETSKESLKDINFEIKEATYGWTPLMLASVDGHLNVVELLVDAGANVGEIDSSGWSAKEHAALRGHIEIANTLAEHDAVPVTKPLNGTTLSKSLEKTTSLENGMNRENGIKSAPAVKSFGHRYLQGESMVLVSLGSMDTKKRFKPVDLDNIPYAEAHATQLDTALSVIVSAQGATGEPTIIDLPVQENISTEPIVFTTKDISRVKILFDIVPTYAASTDQPVARGVALLSAVRPSLGSKKIGLQGDVSVPIVAAKTLDFIGTVNFNFLVATPFSHPNMSITESSMYWRSVTGPMVIGHRGMGKNMASKKSLQLGENTMQSFITAANLGASYVEFDVQLTKDYVPVIYHDFLVSETGIDAPVHALTLEQFLHVNDSSNHSRVSSRSGSPGPAYRANPFDLVDPNSNRPTHRSRANSLGVPNEHSGAYAKAAERMKHTRDMKHKGFKGNSRGNFIQEPFTTLEEMLRKLPTSISFNIEMKYPMLFETELEEMDAYAVELNKFVDTVLQMVFELGGERKIVFSSFHPDICLLLSLKQPSIPVLFLTDAGVAAVGDVRASSLQEAIRFASRWNLLGIVSAAEPLVMCPRLVKVVKESGLVCVSYGTLNNEPENVKKQVDQGIDAVIVDSVLAIRKGLTEGAANADAGKQRSAGLDNGVSKESDAEKKPGKSVDA